MKTKSYYKMGKSSPLFHPQGKEFDGLHYQLLDSEHKDKAEKIRNVLTSYQPGDFESAYKELTSDQFICTKVNGKASEETDAEIMGAKFDVNLAMLSLMAHVDTLCPDSVQKGKEKACASLRHNCQPQVNDRDICLRYGQVHDRKFTRENVEAAEVSVDLETTCLGWFNKDPSFHNTLVATPMEVTNEEVPQARFKTYESWRHCDRWLSRNEFVKGVTFPCLAKLYTIVDGDPDALKGVIKTRFGYDPVMSESKDYNAKTAKAIINVTHFVLNSIWLKYNKFHDWKDFVTFALRLYHIDPDIQKFGGKIKDFSPEWVAIWFRMDELVYFTRIMFNKLFKFRLPMIDGATRKYAADMAILRLFPLTSVLEATVQEDWVVPIKEPGNKCDEHSFISPIVKNPLQLMLYALATKANLAPEKQLPIWQQLSKRKQTTDLKVSGSSFRRIAMQMVENQVDDVGKDSPLQASHWPDPIKYKLKKGEDEEETQAFTIGTMRLQQCKFREQLLDQVFADTDTRFLIEYHYQQRQDKPEDAKKALQQIKTTFLDKNHALTKHRMNPMEKPKCGVLLPIDYLCHWIVHPLTGMDDDDKEFAESQQDIICSYLERNGTFAPFYERMKKKKKDMLYPRSYFSGNFPASDSDGWTGSVQWATCVQRKYVGFYKNVVMEVLKPIPSTKDASLQQLAMELLFSTGLSDFMETVNEFGHEISVPSEWITKCPNFCKWMEPSSKWFPAGNDEENATKTNIPQALALLIILAKQAQVRSGSKNPEILFSQDFVLLYKEEDVFPRVYIHSKIPCYFNPEWYGFARISFRLSLEPDQKTRFSAARMLVHIMEEDKNSTLLKSIEEAVTGFPKIDWVQCISTQPSHLGTAIGKLETYTFEGPIFQPVKGTVPERTPKKRKTTTGASTSKKRRKGSTTPKKTELNSSPPPDANRNTQSAGATSKKQKAATGRTTSMSLRSSDPVIDVDTPNQVSLIEIPPPLKEPIEKVDTSESNQDDNSESGQDDEYTFDNEEGDNEPNDVSNKESHTTTKTVKRPHDPEDQVTVDFTGGVNKSNKKSCLEAMERPQGILIMKGLLNETLVTIMAKLMSELAICKGGGTFREFHVTPKGSECKEILQDTQISFQDFSKGGIKNGPTIDKQGTRKINYMLDMSLSSCLPAFNDSLFFKWFRLPEIWPGGEYCMMHHVGRDFRPDMGPNLFLTFPGPVTSLHMDGSGMVDSAHLCLNGYNEVFMLPRLDRTQTANALKVLQATEALDSLPHDLQQSKIHKWPTKEMVDQLRKQNIAPSIFILEPGQLIHIAKGRLHCFRKLTSDVLPESDVHESLRKSIVQGKQISPSNPNICVSVAWDWMYTGFTVTGQRNELEHVLKKPRIIPTSRFTPELAIPELCLLRMAELFSSKPKEQEKCKFISVLLHELTKKHAEIVHWVHQKRDRSRNYRHYQLTTQNEADVTIPEALLFGRNTMSSNYWCRECARELSNEYYECDGCFQLLDQELYLCHECYSNGKCKTFCLPHLKPKKECSRYMHWVGTEVNCVCSDGGRECLACNLCDCCCCLCHEKFTLRYRFYTPDAHLILVQKVKKAEAYAPNQVDEAAQVERAADALRDLTANATASTDIQTVDTYCNKFDSFCTKNNITLKAKEVMIKPASKIAKEDEKLIFPHFGIPEHYRILDVEGDGNCFIYVTLLILAMENEEGVFNGNLGELENCTALDYVIEFRIDMFGYITEEKVIELRDQMHMFTMGKTWPISNDEIILEFRYIRTTWVGFEEDSVEKTIEKMTLAGQLKEVNEHRATPKGLTKKDELCLVEFGNFVYVFDRYLKKHHPVRLVVIANLDFQQLCTVRVCETTAVNQWHAYWHPMTENLVTLLEDGIKTYVVVYHNNHYTLLVKEGLRSG